MSTQTTTGAGIGNPLITIITRHRLTLIMTIQNIGIIGKRIIGELVGIMMIVGLGIGVGAVVIVDRQIHGGIPGVLINRMIIGGATIHGVPTQIITIRNLHPHQHLPRRQSLQTLLRTRLNL